MDGNNNREQMKNLSTKKRKKQLKGIKDYINS